MKQINPDIFREYDVRGIVNRDLDHDNVYLLGKAIGTYAKTQGVHTMTVGRDCRLSSEEYSRMITEGIVSTGINIIDIGLCTSPMLYFSIRHFKTGGGIMVTGSHNPPQYNGFKICIGPDTVYGEIIQKIRKIMEKGVFEKAAGTVSQQTIIKDYHDHIIQNVNVTKHFSIVVDGGNSVGGLFALPLLKQLNCSTTPLFCDPNGSFPNHFPDPTIDSNLQWLIDYVQDTNADLGIAYDGDGDRLGIITNTGEIVRGDKLLLLFARHVLSENPGATIIGDVKCSQSLYDEITKLGGRPIMWKAGHSPIKQKLREEKALLAGEMTSHLFFADRYFGYDDALYATARLLEILSETNQSISDLLSDFPESYSTPEIRLPCSDNNKFQLVQNVKDYFRNDYRIIDIDGVRITFDQGWALVRASNTEPVLVLRIEAWNLEGLTDIKNLIKKALGDTIQGF